MLAESDGADRERAVVVPASGRAALLLLLGLQRLSCRCTAIYFLICFLPRARLVLMPPRWYAFRRGRPITLSADMVVVV